MSQFLSSMIGPNKDGTVFAHVPLQILSPEEARVMAEQLLKCAELAEQAQKDGNRGPRLPFRK